jgi:hypothetical protein
MTPHRFWQAAAHKWGPARVHREDDQHPGLTLCGKKISDVPGWPAESTEFNCEGALQSQNSLHKNPPSKE